jgi:hypothetical protein
LNDWQERTLSDFELVLNPDTYVPVKANDVDLFDAERKLIDCLSAKLKRDRDQLSTLIDNCGALMDQTRELTEIMGDDQSRTVSVLAIMSTTFLFLALAALCLCISGAATNPVLAGIQLPVWQVAGFLMFGVGAFCLGVAKQRIW